MRHFKNKMKKLEYLATLWPTFPHFEKFVKDKRLSAIRLNSAMVKGYELSHELKPLKKLKNHIPIYFDIKGRQLRVTHVENNKDHLELELNHPIKVHTPTPVLFKAGADHALLKKVEKDRKLIFESGPEYMVYEGESLHIRHPSLEVNGPTFLKYEIRKIQKAKQAGLDRFFLSYVECQKDIDQFREHIGDCEIVAKIENKKGLEYVANEFKKQPNLSLMAARGDLYVELDHPHQIMNALKLIADKDPEAGVGSRLLLSVINSPVPSCSDLTDLAWLYDTGYRKMMLCDEICLQDKLLSTAVNVLESFRQDYTQKTKQLYNPKKNKTKPTRKITSYKIKRKSPIKIKPRTDIWV